MELEERRKAVYSIYLGFWNRMKLHKSQTKDYNRHLDFALKQQREASDQTLCYPLPWGENRDFEQKALKDSGYRIGERDEKKK